MSATLWSGDQDGRRGEWEREARKWGFCETTIREASDAELARQVLETARISTLWQREPQFCRVK